MDAQTDFHVIQDSFIFYEGNFLDCFNVTFHINFTIISLRKLQRSKAACARLYSALKSICLSSQKNVKPSQWYHSGDTHPQQIPAGIHRSVLGGVLTPQTFLVTLPLILMGSAVSHLLSEIQNILKFNPLNLTFIVLLLLTGNSV